jgi:hypothetical protein
MLMKNNLANYFEGSCLSSDGLWHADGREEISYPEEGEGEMLNL